jgi:hypothetical protein
MGYCPRHNPNSSAIGLGLQAELFE